MANTLLTPQIIARETLIALQNNLVLGNLVYTDYSGEFAHVGDTITVRKPATFTAVEDTGTTTYQDITETGVAVKMDKLVTVPAQITAKQLSLSIQDINSQVIQPAARAIAQKVDEYIAGLYADIPYHYKASSTPAISDIAGARKVLNINKAPFEDRSIVFDPNGEAAYGVLDQFIKANEVGDAQNVRNGVMGRILGLSSYLDQNIKTHTKGTWASGTATLTADAGATSGTVAAGGNAKKFVKGDIFTLENVAGSYVVTEEATTAADGSGTVKFYPALPAAVSGVKMTIVSNGSDIQNLAFHKNAFALVSRPTEQPLGGVNSEVINYGGFSIRVIYGYDFGANANLIRFDMLCGVKTLCPELAVRLIA